VLDYSYQLHQCSKQLSSQPKLYGNNARDVMTAYVMS